MRTRHRHRAGRGGRIAWLSALAAALVLAGLAVPEVADHLGRESSGTARAQLVGGDGAYLPFVVEPAVTLVEKVPHPEASPTPEPEQTDRPGRPTATGVPIRLIVPRLGVDAPVIGIRAAGGVLEPPGDPQTLGWWTGGAKPGARFGGALITGHTVHVGGGVFDNLEALAVGDHATVRTAAGNIRYEVTGVTIYRKASLARDAARVFSQTVPGRLVLVTCEDWNGVAYLSNTVVFAEPLPEA